MFIKELNLTGFGKFKYKKFLFKNGLNVIYGTNEAGKSTMHNFMEIMLYGFKSDNSNENLFHKYRPWNSDQYLGSLSVVNTEDEYIIKKDFYKNDYEYFKRDTNTDITSPFNDIQNKEMGEYLFGIDRLTFENTLSIKQLTNSKNGELASEVKEKIVNLSQSKDETISLDKILKRLDEIKEESGDINNPKSLLGQYNARLIELKKNRDKTLDSRNYTLHMAMDKKRKESKIQYLDDEIKSLNNKLELHRISVIALKKAKADSVYAEIQQIKNELSKYGEGNNIGIDDYEEALKLITVLNTMKSEKEKIEAEMLEMNREMVNLKNDTISYDKDESFVAKLNLNYKTYLEAGQNILKLNDKISKGNQVINQVDIESIKELEKLYNKAKSNEKEIERIKNLKNDSSEQLISSLIKSNKIKSVWTSILGVFFILTAGCSGFAGYYFDNIIYYYGTATALISIIMFIITSKARSKMNGLKLELLSNRSEQEQLSDKLKICTVENQKIYNENNCTNFVELEKKYDENNALKEITLEKQKLIEYDKDNLKEVIKNQKILENELLSSLNKYDIKEINDESIKKVIDIIKENDINRHELSKKEILVDQLQHKYKNIEKELDYEQKRCNIILTSNNISCIEEFKTIVDNNYKISQLKDKIAGLERVLENILDNYTYEQIDKILKGYDSYKLEEYNSHNFDQEYVRNEIREKEEQKESIKKEIESIETNIDSVESMERKLVSIEEEIEYYEDKMKESTEKGKIAEIAKRNLMLISDYIKGDFLPLLKSAISDNFNYVTSGNYKEVLIDKDMNISVVNREGKVIDNISALSAGTLDQLYISLRLGLSNLVSDNKRIPLILDDGFTQYDEPRLKKSLEMLSKESKKRQVILFTCQQREINLVDELGIECNMITL